MARWPRPPPVRLPTPRQSVNDHTRSTTSDPQMSATSKKRGMPTIRARMILSLRVSRLQRRRARNGSRLNGNRSTRPGDVSAAAPADPDEPGSTGAAVVASLSAIEAIQNSSRKGLGLSNLRSQRIPELLDLGQVGSQVLVRVREEVD